MLHRFHGSVVVEENLLPCMHFIDNDIIPEVLFMLSVFPDLSNDLDVDIVCEYS